MRWAHPPGRTRGFALSVYDPDAGPAGWWHWLVYNIPGDRRGLAAALAPSAPNLKQGVNDFGTLGYGGPCPPPGPAHHYVFTLYALDVAQLHAAPALRGRAFVALLHRHIIGTATLTGIYRR
jgi:Raf kinase inhibitor-like YbhB/YbcL family protein